MIARSIATFAVLTCIAVFATSCGTCIGSCASTSAGTTVIDSAVLGDPDDSSSHDSTRAAGLWKTPTGYVSVLDLDGAGDDSTTLELHRRSGVRQRRFHDDGRLDLGASAVVNTNAKGLTIAATENQLTIVDGTTVTHSADDLELGTDVGIKIAAPDAISVDAAGNAHVLKTDYGADTKYVVTIARAGGYRAVSSITLPDKPDIDAIATIGTTLVACGDDRCGPVTTTGWHRGPNVTCVGAELAPFDAQHVAATWPCGSEFDREGAFSVIDRRGEQTILLHTSNSFHSWTWVTPTVLVIATSHGKEHDNEVELTSYRVSRTPKLSLHRLRSFVVSLKGDPWEAAAIAPGGNHSLLIQAQRHAGTPSYGSVDYDGTVDLVRVHPPKPLW